MRLEVSAIAHAPVDEVWAWWTDYGEEGDASTVGHGVGVSTRRVVEKSAKRVVLEEDLPLPFLKRNVPLYKHEVLVSDGRWLHERGFGTAKYESKWFFEALPGEGATRITRVIDVPGRGWELVQPAVEPLVRKWALTDLQYHIDEFEEERGGS